MATSDEHRAAFEAWWCRELLVGERNILKIRADGEYVTGYVQIAYAAWQACAAQHAPQERVDDLMRMAEAIAFDMYCYGKSGVLLDAIDRSGLTRLRAALAANPQQITEKRSKS